MSRDSASTALRYVALLCGLVGAVVAATGSLRTGALLFSFAVVVFGVAQVLDGRGERAVNLTILFVGVFSVLGVIAHLLTGL